jgi:citrate lyase subunit beta / citryl-CoA lyase
VPPGKQVLAVAVKRPCQREKFDAKKCMVFIGKNWRPRRSVLFVPAANRRAMNKIAALACDAVIFDLEDSVGPAQKEEARDNLAEGVTDMAAGREAIVRVTPPDSNEFAADLAIALKSGADAILVPKVSDAAEITALRQRIGKSGPSIWVMVENPKAIVHIGEIAQKGAEHGLGALVVGPNDLALTTGVRIAPGRTAILPWLMTVVAAARAYGLTVLDGVCNDFRDLDRLRAECEQGAELGFDGKTLIHPAQIEAANAAFTPGEAEIQRARAIVEAFDRPDNRRRGVIALDGEMVELLHLEAARRLLEAAGKCEGVQNGNETL